MSTGLITVGFYFATECSLATGTAMSGGAAAALVQHQVPLCRAEISVDVKG